MYIGMKNKNNRQKQPSHKSRTLPWCLHLRLSGTLQGFRQLLRQGLRWIQVMVDYSYDCDNYYYYC